VAKYLTRKDAASSTATKEELKNLLVD